MSMAALASHVELLERDKKNLWQDYGRPQELRETFFAVPVRQKDSKPVHKPISEHADYRAASMVSCQLCKRIYD
jgi:hypothetical protein